MLDETNPSAPPQEPSKLDPAASAQPPTPAPARQSDNLHVEYALYSKALPPRAIKLSIPGWAGAPDKMKDGSQPQPWHCLPFVEASTYGLELVYPYDNECHVVNDNGTVRFDWNYAAEENAQLTGGEFMLFEPTETPQFYLFNTRMDVEPPPGHVIRTEPHPRYFTDTTGTVPLSMIGHLQNEWFPRKLFVVFRVPPPGTRHIFRKNEPFAQILFVPQRVGYDLAPMSPRKEASRRELEKVMIDAQQHIATNLWRNPQGSSFSNYYKILARAFAEGGAPAVQAEVAKAVQAKSASLQGKSIPEYLTLGRQHLEKNQFDKARDLYLQVLSKDPRNPDALSHCGIAVACSGAVTPGLKMMTDAVALAPGVPLYHFNLGKIYALLRRFQDSETSIRAALRLAPSDPALHTFLAFTLHDMNRLEDAAQSCRAALQLNPNLIPALFKLGTILAQQAKPAEARAAFERVLQLSPDSQDARRALQSLPSAT